MPELPEVETIRRDLAGAVAGRPIGRVEVTGLRTVRRTSPVAVVNGLSGRTIVGVRRRGKYLLLRLDSGDDLLVHLRMSGQLLLSPAASPRPKHTHVVLGLDDDEELRFVDPRTFGEVVVLDPGSAVPVGPDAHDDLGSVAAFRAVILGRHRRLKYLLTDQPAIAGLGNIYADEVLHRAGLAPWRVSSGLTPAEVRCLHGALGRVLEQAIAARGSTLGDAQYVDLWGRPGGFQLHHRVYGRAGLPCPRCGAPVHRTRWSGRSTFWCPSCQA